jgi:hypothetical protein
MRALIARWGHDTFVEAKVIEPTDAFFPDRYTPDLRGVRTVARRLLRYAGLGALEVDVIGSASETLDPLAATSVFLSDVDATSIELTVASLGSSESGDVPLVLAHEVARAHRVLRPAPAHGAHPYRAVPLHDRDAHDESDDGERDDDEGEDDDEGDDGEVTAALAEHQVALTACYLGFGVLVAKGGHFYRATGAMEGNIAITRWAHHAIGGISPDEACFHLAAQAVVRRMVEPARGWARHLPANQAALLTRELDALEGREDDLARALGLPPRDEWPSPRAEAIEPLPDDDWEPPDEGDDEDDEEPAHVVFRRHRDTAFNAAAVAGVASGVGVLGAAYALPALAIVGLILAPIVVVIAYRSGKRLRRRDLCSACDAELDEDAARCPRCAGVLSGEIRVGESIFDAEERAGLPTFGARQIGAGAAGEAPGNKCPHCGFRPDGEPRWDCASCDGDPFDPFASDGCCPACEAPVEEALCPTCKHVAPYEFWCA